MCTYSVVIPVYKSGPWIPELVERLDAVMRETGESYEILLINDCSPDKVTWPAIIEAAAKHETVTGIDLLYNVGQFRAILCGFEEARGEYIITMDDDLQHPPEEIPKLLDGLRDNPEMDCIVGSFPEKKHSLLRNLGSRFFRGLARRVYNFPKGFQGTNFRILRADIAKSLVRYRTAKPQIGPMLWQTTRNIMNLPVRHEPRKRGKSGYSFLSLMSHTLDSIINASTAPLRLFSLLGFLAAGVSFLLGAIFFTRWALGYIKAPGFTTIILLISFFSGMILAAIGMVGEYIGRIITEITGHEKFHVRTRAGSRGDR